MIWFIIILSLTLVVFLRELTERPERPRSLLYEILVVAPSVAVWGSIVVFLIIPAIIVCFFSVL